MPIHLEVVTGERVVYSDDVESIVIPGHEGEAGILPRHAALMTTLQPGELRINKGGETILLAISGGFVEVLPHKVTVLADTAERADEIDEQRAEAARLRAQERLAQAGKAGLDATQAQASMRRAMVRLKVARKRSRRAR